jgi:hypothetical protein
MDWIWFSPKNHPKPTIENAEGGYRNSKGWGGEEQWVDIGSWGKIIGAPILRFSGFTFPVHYADS